MKKICITLISLFLVACSDNNSTSAPVAQPTVSKGQAAAAPVQKQGSFATITPQQANQLIQTKKNLLLLDVRSPEELREGKIKGSTLVPFWEIAKGKYTVPRTQPVLLVCAVGGRSYAVGQYLNRSGYPEVYNLKGGMSAWKQAGLPVVY